jgi:hypothetical protein
MAAGMEGTGMYVHPYPVLSKVDTYNIHSIQANLWCSYNVHHCIMYILVQQSKWSFPNGDGKPEYIYSGHLHKVVLLNVGYKPE